MASDERFEKLDSKLSEVKAVRKHLSKTSVTPESAKDLLEEFGSSPLKQKVKAEQILTRPHIKLKSMISVLDELGGLARDDVVEQVEIRVKYEGYIEKERAMADKMSKFENLPMPQDLDYVQSLLH